ncbi:hypothetical protein REPUB_Repub14bG0086000 [Reevesia pubescens]
MENRVVFSKEEKQQLRMPWRNALIVKLLGKVLGFQTLSARAKQLWQLEGKYKVVDLGQDYFLFKFEKKVDYKHVLEGRPWIIGGHYLTVRQWTLNFNPNTDIINKVIAWVRLPGLPMEYYSQFALLRLWALVGRGIKVDRNTEDAIRGRFARLCIEVDLTKALVSLLFIGKHKQVVEYEGLHMVCFHCGKFGHKQETCPARVSCEPPSQTDASPVSTNQEAVPSDEKYGPWMLAQRRNQRPQRDDARIGKAKEGSDSRRNKGNQFAVLNEGSKLDLEPLTQAGNEGGTSNMVFGSSYMQKSQNKSR